MKILLHYIDYTLCINWIIGCEISFCRYKLFRFHPSNANASKLIFSTFEDNERTEIWSMRRNEIDVMVTKESVETLQKVSLLSHTPYTILIDDIERYCAALHDGLYYICVYPSFLSANLIFYFIDISLSKNSSLISTVVHFYMITIEHLNISHSSFT